MEIIALRSHSTLALPVFFRDNSIDALIQTDGSIDDVAVVVLLPSENLQQTKDMSEPSRPLGMWRTSRSKSFPNLRACWDTVLTGGDERGEPHAEENIKRRRLGLNRKSHIFLCSETGRSNPFPWGAHDLVGFGFLFGFCLAVAIWYWGSNPGS